jgi:hypothetical protein
VYFLIHGHGDGHKCLKLPTKVVQSAAGLRDAIIRHWPLDHVAFNERMIGGKYNPFDLQDTLAVNTDAFKTVCRLISDEH